MLNRKTVLQSFAIILFAFTSTSRAELKWIAEKDRTKAKLSGDFKTMDGKRVSLADFKSKVVFLNFWATWCAPCRQEMPSMARLYAHFRDLGLEMVAVTTESTDAVQKFLADQSFDFTTLIDSKDALGARFRTEIVPTTIVIDAQGRIALRQRGAFEWDSAETLDAFRNLLTEQTPR